MFKRTLILAALIASPALAQQAPADPVAATYAQLLGEANGRVANLSAEVSRDQAKIADLQKQLDAEKAKSAPKPDSTPGGK